jgi:hypothetical protein
MFGQLYSTVALPTGERALIVIDQEAGSASEAVWTRWRREQLTLLPGIEP